MDKFDQTALGMLAAIKGCFTKHTFSELWDKLIHLSADGASVNSAKDSWLGIVHMVFQSSLEIGTEGCILRFYKSGGRIVDTLVLSLSKIFSKS